MKGPHLLLSCLLYSVFLSFGSLSGQNVLVTVITENEDPISHVEILSDDYGLVITDDNGQAQIDTFQSSTFLFDKAGYSQQVLDLRALEKLAWTVELKFLAAELENITILEQTSFKESDKFHLTQAISSTEIKSTQSQTSADVLSHHGGVYVQKSQMGGGSPIIRGFEANRVLLVVDGVRMNNAIYRSGHLQNAITVDASILQDVKVIFGPNSLAYGSDAIGGVVAYKTKSPKLSLDDQSSTESALATRYSTANNEKYVHGDVNIGWKKWGSLTSITVSDYGDLKAGSNRDELFPNFGLRTFYVENENGVDEIVQNLDPNVQVGTKYRQMDVLQKLLYKPNENLFITGNVQFSTSGDVPRYDNLQEERNNTPRYAEWYYGPQNRLMISSQVKNYNTTKYSDKFIITTAYQRIDEDRVSRLFESDIRSTMNEDVNVFSLTGEFEKQISSNWQVLYGFDSQWNTVNSSASSEDISSGVTRVNVLTRYANAENRYLTYGLFGEVDWSSPFSPFALKAGLRYSGNNWKVRYNDVEQVEWPTSFLNGINGHNQAINWSLSGLYGSDKGWQMRIMLSSAFRAPNIDDLSKIRVNANEISFPNTNLNPEKSISTETSVGFRDENFNLSATTFYTRLSDAIVRRPFVTPDGSSTYLNFGEELQVVANQNAQNANVYGFSLNAIVTLGDSFKISTQHTLTKGREKLDGSPDRPFAHIPPAYGDFKMMYTKNNLSLKSVIRYNAPKDIDDYGGPVDNPDLATPIGALSWTTYNIYGTYSLTQAASVTVAVENIMDIHYRPFASGISAPGRNIIIGFRYNWN